jgi:tRNA 2-thiouridine synthesizing protein A
VIDYLHPREARIMAVRVDARGKSCPLPIVLLAKAMRSVEIGQDVTVLADDRAFPADVKAWCAKTGNPLLSLTEEGLAYAAAVKRAV